MTFNFNYNAETSPRPLAVAYNGIPETGWKKLGPVLDAGCNCTDRICTSELTRRQVGRAICVYLQCNACGRALGGGAFAKNEHPQWEAYPWWNQELVEKYDRAAREHATRAHEALLAQYAEREAKEVAAFARRRSEYATWLQASPEWKKIRDLVMWRSRQRCEACLSSEATVVHHLTYDLGKLPPAWQLKAVCTECHDRLHDGDDEWCEHKMARSDELT